MKKTKFYICPVCGNVLPGTGEAEISCCGRKLMPAEAKKEDLPHEIKVEEIEGDLYVTLEHEMEKQHYITFVAHVSYDRVLLVKLYPEQDAQVRFPRPRRGALYVCCTKHGLYMKNLV